MCTVFIEQIQPFGSVNQSQQIQNNYTCIGKYTNTKTKWECDCLFFSRNVLCTKFALFCQCCVERDAGEEFHALIIKNIFQPYFLYNYFNYSTA